MYCYCDFYGIRLRLESDGRLLTGISFFSSVKDGNDDTGFEHAAVKGGEGSDECRENNVSPHAFESALRWLEIYFSRRQPDFMPPYELKGTDFQLRVWKKLLEIPFGKTSTYGAIAKAIAAETGKEKMSAQAVGNAVGKNPLAIMIPCHRIIGSDGSLTGFSGGLEIKRRLLLMEGADLSIE